MAATIDPPELPALPFHGLVKVLSEDFQVRELHGQFAIYREVWFRRLCKLTETDCETCVVATYRTRREARAVANALVGADVRKAA